MYGNDPPWMEREWVTSEEGRTARLGHELNCIRCDELGLKVAKAVLAESKKCFMNAYNEAGLSGLCEEGRIEYAIGGLDLIDLKTLIEKAR